MRDVIDQINKLLALAESPAEEEARSAAMQAVRLIKKHKIELRMPGVNPPTDAHPFDVPPWNGFMDEFMKDVFRTQAKRPASTPKYHYEPKHGDSSFQEQPKKQTPHDPPPCNAAQPNTPPPNPPSHDKPPVEKEKRSSGNAIPLISRYKGNCKMCGKPYFAGEKVLWMKLRGTTHEKCASYWEDKE